MFVYYRSFCKTDLCAAESVAFQVLFSYFELHYQINEQKSEFEWMEGNEKNSFIHNMSLSSCLKETFILFSCLFHQSSRELQFSCNQIQNLQNFYHYSTRVKSLFAVSSCLDCLDCFLIGCLNEL